MFMLLLQAGWLYAHSCREHERVTVVVVRPFPSSGGGGMVVKGLAA